MKIVKPTNLGLLPRPFTFGGQSALCVSAYAFFSFDRPHELLEESALWEAVAGTLLESEIFDTGEPKPRAEYLAYGRCHPKDSARAARIRLRVGSLEKTLEIYGDRTWSRGIPGDPAMLDPLRICWQHAYGGPGHAYNPLGKGFAPDADGSVALPNILPPDKTARPEDATLKPAGLTAYPLEFPQRTRHYGRFDKNWLRDSWPYLPQDTNPEYFMTAPEDQRFPGFLQGDEPVFVEGMHPHKKILETALPGLRARIFAKKQGAETLAEAPARADTLWLLPEQELAILCYRAQMPVADEEASDVTHLLAVWELQSETPQTGAYYQTFLQQQLAAEEALAEEIEPEEPDAPPPPEAEPEEAAPEAPEDPELAALREETAKIEADTRALQQKHGISDQELEKYRPKKQAADAALSEADLQKATAQIEADTNRLLQEKGLTMRDVERMAKERSGMDQAVDLKTAIQQALANDKLAPDAKGKIQAALAEVTEAEQALAALEAKLAAAAGVAAPQPEEEKQKAPKPQEFAGQDLSGRDFSGQDLRDTDFSNAVLADANFSGADCTRADFSNAVLSKANFSDSRCENTLFAKATAPGACFKSAKMRQAVLAGGDFTDSDFSDAKMREADMSEALFENAVLWNLAAAKAVAANADFSKADLTGADLSEAVLTGADFTSAKIASALFSKAHAREARFFGTVGDASRFESADLADSRADADTQLPGANFSHAAMQDAKWGGARLPQAKFLHVELDRADFSGADFSGATINGVTARHANFSKTIFEDAHVLHSNFLFASLRKASLVGAKLHQSNLFGADLYKIRVANASLAELNLKRTLLDPALFAD